MSIDLDFITTRPMPFKALDKKTDYISREALLKMVGTMPSSPITDREERLIRAFISTVKNFPAADVRPVVLCKDCRHRDPEDHKCDSGEMERQGCPFKVADDYFCAYGEKREES